MIPCLCLVAFSYMVLPLAAQNSGTVAQMRQRLADAWNEVLPLLLAQNAGITTEGKLEILNAKATAQEQQQIINWNSAWQDLFDFQKTREPGLSLEQMCKVDLLMEGKRFANHKQVIYQDETGKWVNRNSLGVVTVRLGAETFTAPDDTAPSAGVKYPIYTRLDVIAEFPARPATPVWLRVGENVATARKQEVWIKKEKTVDWPSNIAMQFIPKTQSSPREDVLAFGDKDTDFDLLKTLVIDAGKRDTAWKEMHQLMQAKKYDDLEKLGVIGKEPLKIVHDNSMPWLMPVTRFEMLEDVPGATDSMGKPPVTLLHVYSAVEATSAKRMAESKNNITVDTRNEKTVTYRPAEIVFVMDTSGSMKPFVQDLLRLIQSVSAQVAGQTAEGRPPPRFGFWGYRDDPDSATGVGYRTRLFGPSNRLVPTEEFAQILELVDTPEEDTKDSFPEDAFAGLEEAFTHTPWGKASTDVKDGPIKVIIWIGDAPSHEGKESWTQKTLEEMKRLRDARECRLFSFHIAAPTRSDKHHRKAHEQFRELASLEKPGQTPGSNNVPLFYSMFDPIVGHATPDLSKGVEQMMSAVSKVIEDNYQGQSIKAPQPSLLSTTPQSDAPDASDVRLSGVLGKTKALFEGAEMVTISKRYTQEMTAWIVNRDFATPLTGQGDYAPSVGAYVLLTLSEAKQVSNLLTALNEAIKKPNVKADDIIQAMRNISAGATLNPSSLLDQNMPVFVSQAPYKSRILKYNFRQLADELQKNSAFQQEIRAEISRKARYFENGIKDDFEFYELPSSAPGRSTQEEKVTAIPVEMLP